MNMTGRRKRFCVLLAAALLALCCAPVNGTAYGARAGDIDGDGAVTPADARYALRLSVGLSVLPDAYLGYADADGDGKVDPADARLILRCAVSLEPESALRRFQPQYVSSSGEIPYRNRFRAGTAAIPEGETLILGEEFIRRKDAAWEWKSSNPEAAMVAPDGTVTALKKGFACVYLTNGGARYYYFVSVLTPLQARIYALQDKYPDGYYWNAYPKSEKYPEVTETPCSDHDSGEYAYCIGQCAGFAELLSDEVFGYEAPVHRDLSVEDIKIGDYVRCLPHHSVFVIDRIDEGEIVGYDIYEEDNFTAYCDYLTVAECNWDCRCGIAWGRTIRLDRLEIDPYYSYSRY